MDDKTGYPVKKDKRTTTTKIKKIYTGIFLAFNSNITVKVVV